MFQVSKLKTLGRVVFLVFLLTTTMTYTGSHLLASIVNSAGQIVEQNTYDGQGRPIAQQDALGHGLTLSYGNDGRTVVTDARRNAAVDEYDILGTLIAQQKPQGAAPTYSYDDRFNRTAVTDARGNTTRYGYGPDGQPTIITDALDATTHITYDPATHKPLSVRDALGRVSSFRYDANGDLTSQSDALGHTTVYTYNASGQLTATTDPQVRTTQYGYDDLGQRIAVTDASGNTTHYGYDAVGRLITTTTPLGPPGAGGGLVTVNEYDQADHLIRVTSNYTTAGGQNYLNEYNLVTEYGYDLAGRQVQVSNTKSQISKSEYDVAGRLVRSIQNYLPGYSQNWQNQYNIVTEYAYDEAGNQVMVTGTLGHVTKTEYDALNRPVTVTMNYVAGGPVDAETNLTRITGYDANGNVVTQTTPLGPPDAGGGLTTVTQYDALNRPVTVTTNYVDGVYDPAHPDEDLSTVAIYDAVGSTIAQRDEAGYWTHSAYDELGRLITATNALSGTTVTQYNEAGQRVATIDPAGHVTRYEYDAAGRLVTTTDALSGTMVTVYDALGRRAASVNALGQRAVYTYSATGRLMATAGPSTGSGQAVRTTQYEYDALGRTAAVTDALGHATRTEYDALGRAVTTTRSVEGGAWSVQSVTQYDALGRRTAMQDARGNWTTFEYDALGRVITTTEPSTGSGQAGRATVVTYDRAGNRIADSRWLMADGRWQMAGGQTFYEYDKLGRLIAQSDALGNTTRYGYDALGNRVVMTDANGVATRYEYDALSRLTTVIENYVSGGPSDHQTNLVTRYAYDAVGNRVKISNAKSQISTFVYDALNRLVSQSDPMSNTTHYQYDALGNRTVMTDANGITTHYTYDAAGRLLVTLSPSHLVTYSYDALGNRVAMTDSTGTTTYIYDALYRPITITSPFSGVVGYRYDANGNRTQLIYPSGQVVSYTYDAANRLTSVVDWAGQTTMYEYDWAGRLVTTTLPNGVSSINTYDLAGRLVQISNLKSTISTTILLSRFEYELDAVGNRVAVTETIAQPAGPGPVRVTVQDTDGAPQVGLPVYVFSGTTYMNYNGTTNASGQVTITLPAGAYRFRADKNGTQFWSGPSGDNHCAVPLCDRATVIVSVPVVVTVQDTDGTLQAGLPVYAFDGSTYTNYNSTTNATGQVTLTLPFGNYRFRADKNGTQFWSGPSGVNHCTVPGCTSTGITVSVPVVITVRDTDGAPGVGLPVYAFSGTTYMNYAGTTNAYGQVALTLPFGPYRFRADKNGTQFWSGTSNHCPIPGCTSTVVTVSVPVVVTVQDSSGTPEVGLPVYAFDGNTYTNYAGMTNDEGRTTLTLPLGSYRFRADKNGTQFWSGLANHCAVPGCTSAAIGTSLLTVVTVRDASGAPEAGLPVYAFDGNTYTNYAGTTNASGQVTFTLPFGNYRFRSDKNGTQFWSGPANHCTLPGCTSVSIATTLLTIVTVRDTDGTAQPGLPVYAFDGATYKNMNGTTSASGQVTFTLAAGNYRFRADKSGTQFWSGAANHCAVPGCASAAITVSIPVVVSVRDTDGAPGVGLPVYAFSGTTYMNYNGTTNATGQVTLTLPLGSYRFRADKSGTQFWSSASNHCSIPGCTSTAITVSVPVVVSVRDTDGVPGIGLPVYAFSGTAYMNYNGTANASGQVTFTLPFGNYRFRADKSGTQFWSGPGNHCTIPGCTSTVVTVSVPVVVTVQDSSGAPQASVPVYAFDGSTYTNYNGTTNASGQVTLTLPFGPSGYRFRADKSGTQYWSGSSNHCTVPGCVSATVTLTTGGASNNDSRNALASTRLWLDPTILSLAPLMIFVMLGQRRKKQRWVAPLTVVLLAASLVGIGMTLGEGINPPQVVVAAPAVQPASGAGIKADVHDNRSGDQLANPPRLYDQNLTSDSSLMSTHPASTQVLTTATVVSHYIYDPLRRLTGATYSDGKSFQYQYDAVGNRTAMTSTMPLSGTVATTYVYDAANRLTNRTVSDGRVYTYTWSARGEMLAEWTHGYAVRTFSYNGAGQMTQATVFTLTTRFWYDGDGARRVVEVVGRGATTYALDYAADDRVLAEGTITGTTLYLYGRDCLGELANNEWLYYLPDATGYVRQGTDKDGQVTVHWAYDPDGTVLEGRQGLVSHLVCGGIYDWSTGLIYKGGRYFDPSLGIWLALTPLIVIQSWQGRRKKRRGLPWYVVLLFVVCVGGLLTACGGGGTGTSPTATATATACVEEKIVGRAVDNYMAFVDDATYINPTAYKWPPDKIKAVTTVYEDAVRNGYVGARGFGSLDEWAQALGVTKADPNSKHAGGAIRLSYVVDNAAHGGWTDVAACGRLPGIEFGDSRTPVAETKQAYHELAHIWDGAALQGRFSTSMQTEMGVAGNTTDKTNHGNFPTDYAKTGGAFEDFAESVTAYFLVNDPNPYAENKDWSDDDPRYRDASGNSVKPDTDFYPPDKRDRYDYIERLLGHGK